jgi:hypothetical protein
MVGTVQPSCPIGSMVLVYMLTWRGYIDGIHVTIYSSTMDLMDYLVHFGDILPWSSLPEKRVPANGSPDAGPSSSRIGRQTDRFFAWGYLFSSYGYLFCHMVICFLGLWLFFSNRTPDFQDFPTFRFSIWGCYTHMRTMVLEYWPTFPPILWPKCR